MLERETRRFDRLCQFPHNRRAFRSMIAGYYVDENGLATDKDGNSIGEHFPGEFLNSDNASSQLHPYCSPGIAAAHLYDDLRFVDLTENPKDLQRGNINADRIRGSIRVRIIDTDRVNRFVTRIDVQRGEGINELYALIACNDNYERAIDALDLALALRKVKNTAYTEVPYYQDLTYLDRIINCQLKDAGMLNLAKLRGVIRNTNARKLLYHTTTAQIEQLAFILDPKNREVAFPQRSIIGWRGSRGQIILPMAINEANQLVLVHDDESAGYENFMLAAAHLIVNPAVHKIERILQYLQTESDFDSVSPSSNFSSEHINALKHLIFSIEAWTNKGISQF